MFTAWKRSALIFGDVGLGHFPLILVASDRAGRLPHRRDEVHGWVLCQLDDLQRTSDLDLERADEIGRGELATPDPRTPARRRPDHRLPGRPGHRQGPDDPVPAGRQGLPGGGAAHRRGPRAQAPGNAGAYVGLLRNHALQIELDINQLVQRHVSVLAKTGGGKSYLLGVLIEELLRHKVTCVIIDPHGEYGSLRHPAEKQRATARFGVRGPGVRQAGPRVLPRRRAQPVGEAAHLLAPPHRPAGPARLHGPDERQDVPRPAQGARRGGDRRQPRLLGQGPRPGRRAPRGRGRRDPARAARVPRADEDPRRRRARA